MLADAPFNDLTHEIIAAAIEVHRTLGPGLLESVYQPCLEYELAARRLPFARQRSVAVTYKDLPFDSHYRLDLIVDERVVVEVKAIEHQLPIHQAQLLTYVVLARCPAGLLINFNVTKLIDGVKRVINPKLIAR